MRINKLLILCFTLLFTPTCAFAQWEAESEISDFSKMMVSHVNPYTVPDGAALEVRNFRANQLIGALTKRPPMLLYGDAGDFAITGLHKYYQADDDKFLLVSGSTYLKSDENGDRTFFIIRDELTDGARFTFLTYKDKAIACNGVDMCQKYDGHIAYGTDAGDRSTNILTTDLGAPFATLATGTDLDASSWYSYKIQFTTASASYYSDAVSNPILTGASDYNIDLSDIPLGPAGTTSRSIYRTEGQASRAALDGATYKLVGTISDNSTQTYSDSTADGSLSTTWSTTGKVDLTPPIGKFCLIHKESLWIANNPSNKSDVYWSYAFKPDIFHPDDYEPIRQEDGDEITGIFNLLGVLAISKTNAWMKFQTLSSDQDQWQVLGPYSLIGIQAPYASAQSPLGVIYVSKDGLYIYNGESSQLISDVVTKELRDALWTSRGKFAGVYYTNEYHMAYPSIESGASVNDRVIVVDLERDAYVIDDKGISAFEVFDSGTDEGGIYAGSSADDGEIFANDQETENLIFKTKSVFNTWTANDVVVLGSENDPYFEIGWTESLDDLVGVGLNASTYANSILARPDTDGVLTSPGIQVNAESYDKIYWNEDLNVTGDVTFQVRSAATEAGLTGQAWSSAVSDPSGSDISGLTANDWMQIRANLSTTDITKSPKVIRVNNYNVKFVYNREGAEAESAVNALWESGMMSFGEPRRMKRLWEVEVMYEGDAGTITFDIEGNNGFEDQFTIDLSVDGDDSTSDAYTENALGKTYLYRFPLDGEAPIDYYFQYKISESSLNTFKVFKIKTRYSLEDVI